MKSFLLKTLLISLCSFMLFSCEDKESENNSVPQLTRKVNNFIMEWVEMAYLWNNTITATIDTSKESDPFQLFGKIRYDELDKWSYLTDDADALFKDYEGISTTYGYRLTVYRVNDTECFAVVRFVYPDSPAEKAGIERGDILVKMDGGSITINNYLDLHYSSDITLQFGEYNSSTMTIYALEETVTMKAVEMYLDPVREYNVIDKGSRKIGYLCYTDYVEGSHDKLLTVFQYFKESQVTDVVLDLRYNPGGATKSTNFLCSILAPASALENESVFLHEIWNDNYMAYFQRQGEDMNDYFNKDIQVNMDLDHIYVLTSENTASASEATIVGLMPYMDVFHIGETTHGKYCAAALLRPEDEDGNVDEEIGDWAMSLVIYKFTNADGYTDFSDGISPTYSMEMEDEWWNYRPLGDEDDPMLAKAISVITGKAYPVAPRSVDKPTFEPLPANKQPDARRGGMLRLEK